MAGILTWFRRRERPPLGEALRLAEEAAAILERHWRDRAFRPSEAELAQVDALSRRLFALAARANRLAIRLERRRHGEPEVNEARWHG